MRVFVLLFLLAARLSLAQTAALATGEKPGDAASVLGSQAADTQSTAEASFNEKVRAIAASGRVQMIGETASSRLQPAARLAPGAPPILAFRYFDGQARHRFGDLDWVMDDAGH